MNAIPLLRDDDGTSSRPLPDSPARRAELERTPAQSISDIMPPAWEAPVDEQLVQIVALEDGWDGYRAGPIRRDVIGFAVRVLDKIMRSATPVPRITPMSNGGLMLEWHQNGLDLELEIERPGSLWFSFEDSVENIEVERPLTSDLRHLSMPIDKLTKRALLKG